MPPASTWHKPVVANSAIAGAGAGRFALFSASSIGSTGKELGLVSSVVTCPLDVIKTKLQAQSTVHGAHGYLGIRGTITSILRNQGIRGLYRGLGPTILGYLPTWAIYFAVYDETKKWLGDNARGDSSTEDGHLRKRQAWATHLIAAMTAGASGTIATSPLWVIKTRFMTQPQDELQYRHTWDAFRTIYRTEGWKAFYRGLLPSLLGVAHVAVQFPLYEQLKHWFADRRGISTVQLSSGTIFLCSALSKMTASVATYPHEVIRTRLQIQRNPHSGELADTRTYRGFVQTTVRIVRREGWRGLYKGLSINLVRTIPNNAVTLVTYELLMRRLSNRR
ncbi:mitochondrial NAD transporter [Rhizoctonia solani]|uniref:Mitochondrial NAD transporter n=2 Tax=Rhizoctonia solani TaxID=456999 RepID=A0A8H7H4Y9_9AGAM|nr:mitochondrial NAD transporter [Rhizoctonia solani]